MSAAIWKYPLLIADEQTITIPDGSRALHIDVQEETLCLWLYVDPSAPRVEQTIHLYGTGHPIPDDADQSEFHIGTVQIRYSVSGQSMDRILVWHAFWVVR